MDKTEFDAVARRVGDSRLSRAMALRGLGVLALAGLLEPVGAGANGKKKPKTKPVCLCATADATKCRTVEIAAKKAKQKAAAKCNYTGRCKPGVVAARCRCGSGGPCRVFLTSTTHTGNLGGLSGADAICQGLAETAGLPGTYKAWLSDSTGSPSTRFVQSAKPYVLVNGTSIAADWADLTTCDAAAPFACLAHAIDTTETGAAATDSSAVWTSTLSDGSAVPGDYHCQNWSETEAGARGTCAKYSAIDQYWTTYCDSDCTFNQEHLYCFQQS